MPNVTRYQLDTETLKPSRVAVYRLNAAGRVEVSYDDPKTESYYRIDDVLRDDDSVVTPDDGEAFLDGLLEQQWTYARFVRE